MDIADFWARINSLIKLRKTTQRVLSIECGLTERRIESLVSNGRLPDAIETFRIAQALETTVEYLVTEKPPGGISPEILEMAKKILALPPQDREEIKVLLEHKLRRGPDTEQTVKKYGEYSRTPDGMAAENGPVYLARAPEPPYVAATAETEGFDNVESIDYDMVGILYLGDKAATAAGNLIEMLDDPKEYETIYVSRDLIKGDPRSYFCLMVRGTSMTRAGIADGDIAVLRTADTPESGAIMLVSYEEKSTLKRIAVKNKAVFLQWEDGSGKEEKLKKEGYRVLGKLHGILAHEQKKA